MSRRGDAALVVLPFKESLKAIDGIKPPNNGIKRHPQLLNALQNLGS
jgi:hypothetical protein